MTHRRVLAPFVVIGLAVALVGTSAAQAAHAASSVKSYEKALPAAGMKKSWTADFSGTTVGRVGTNTLCVETRFRSDLPAKFTLQFASEFSPSVKSSRRTVTSKQTVTTEKTCWSVKNGNLDVGLYDQLKIVNEAQVPYAPTTIYGTFTILSCSSNDGRC